MSNSFKPIILITGATATGKTKCSLDLAKIISEKGIECEIINADSLLFYRELNIGTAKPSHEELSQVPHHLINNRSIKNPMNASEFYNEANKTIQALFSKNKIPIITGGSAFYVRALIKGLYNSNSPSLDAIEEIDKIEESEGYEKIRELLLKHDPESFERLHYNDKYRNKRALEHFFSTGIKFSELRDEKEKEAPYDFSRPKIETWRIHNIYLDIPKEEHWDIILKRIDKMFENGLVNEVKELSKNKHNINCKPLQSIGYKETLHYLGHHQANNVEITNLQELRERIFINTRRLAKSQRTFFKKCFPKKVYHPLKNQDKIIIECLEFLHQYSNFK